MFINLRITRNPLSRRGGSRLSILTRYRGETFFFTPCNLNSIHSAEKQREREREIVIHYGFLVSFEEITLLSETKVFKIITRNFTEDIGYSRAKRNPADDNRVFV